MYLWISPWGESVCSARILRISNYLYYRSLTVRLPEVPFQDTSLLYYFIVHVNPSKIAFLSFRFHWESGCKGKDFFDHLPNFFETFFRKFFGGGFRRPLFMGRVPQEGQTRKFPGKPPGSVSFPVVQPFNQHRFVPESGCKSRGFIQNSQILLTLFWRKFESFLN